MKQRIECHPWPRNVSFIILLSNFKMKSNLKVHKTEITCHVISLSLALLK